MKKELIIVLALFIVTFIIGYQADGEELIEAFSLLQDSVLDQHLLFIFLRILLQNIFVCALMFFGGYVMSIPTVFILITNGYSLGILSNYFVSQTSALNVILRILPHGVFELSAFFLSAAYGLKITQNIMKKKWTSPKPFLLIVILLTIAALIETLAIFLSV